MKDNFFKRSSIFLISGWLLFFALLPFVLVIVASFLKSGDVSFLTSSPTLHNYIALLQASYITVFLRSFWLSIMTVFFCLLLGYPFAYLLSRLSERWRVILIFMLIIPFWTSSLIRIYATIIIIRTNGLLNQLLLWLHLIHHPFQLLYTKTAVLIGLVYALLPFMILPLYSNMERFNWQLLEAARDLGAGRIRILLQIMIPNTISGIVAGIILVLLPAMTLFYIPDILGGGKSLLLGNLIKDQFLEAHNWPLGSAAGVVLTLLLGVLLMIYWHVSSEKDRREDLRL